MVKKRIIFTLLFYDNFFCLSRNFNIQKIGNYQWLQSNYDFSKISFYIDELIIIDISREKRDIVRFSEMVKKISSNSFVPISAGGGVDNIEKAEILFRSGADKILLNTTLFNNSKFIKVLSKNYGNQSIVASIDYKLVNGKFFAYIENGSKKLTMSIQSFLKKICKMSIGEIYLNSIDQDGTGQGYNMGILKLLPKNNNLPIIMAGGAGNYNHLVDGLNNPIINAVASANLLNFVGDGLKIARKKIIEKGFNLAVW